MNCDSCAHWQPYTQIFFDAKANAVRELELVGCELRRTKVTCDGNYISREISGWEREHIQVDGAHDILLAHGAHPAISHETFERRDPVRLRAPETDI